MKTLVLFLVIAAFAACDAGTVDIQVEAPTTGTCVTTPVQQFGGTPCLLQVPSGVDCTSAKLLVDGVAAPEGEYSRVCGGAMPQLAAYGATCSALEHRAVATVGCVGLPTP